MFELIENIMEIILYLLLIIAFTGVIIILYVEYIIPYIKERKDK